ncbi:MAG: helical backbone metal receptor [Myxococcota bacterium]|nr:helical backbone metal receptor [Myxococcota bacterium]
MRVRAFIAFCCRSGGGLLAVGLVLFLSAALSRADASRIVSLNPSLTSILVALGAGDRLVGVDDYSARQIAAVEDLPRVGGLFNPSLESVLALRPDLVVLVPSAEQRGFQSRLTELGIRVESFQNIRFEEVLENIARIGALTGEKTRANERIAAIERASRVARALTQDKEPQSVLVVLQRDPLYVVGRGNFVEEILAGLGLENAAATFDEAYPRVGREWVVERAPDIVIDLSPELEAPGEFWSRWPSIPAVENGRVIGLDASLISMPGPDLDRATHLLLGSVYGRELAAQLEAESRP